jgi:hypothetical protein
MLHDPLATVGPEIPLDGLSEVLSRWSGLGRLYEGLAAVRDESGRKWQPKDIEKRAHRILVDKLVPTLELLPTRQVSWLEILPASIRREKFSVDSPRHGVSWRESRRHGWLPRHFVGQTRNRQFSRELLESLAWTLEHLMHSWRLIDRANVMFSSVCKQILVGQQVLAFLISEGVEPARPTSTALAALRQEGRIWRIAERIADHYRALTRKSMSELAHELIWPDPELRGRLFHLAVLGKLLLEIRKAGGAVVSTSPLRESSAKPVYSISFNDETWELWFEGAGMWRHHGHRSPYSTAMRGVEKRARPLSPDIVLLRPGSRGLILECKHSADPEYVCKGYAQVSAYANEIRSLLSEKVEALVVGPRGVVTQPSAVQTWVGAVGAISPEHMSDVVARLLRP